MPNFIYNMQNFIQIGLRVSFLRKRDGGGGS